MKTTMLIAAIVGLFLGTIVGIASASSGISSSAKTVVPAEKVFTLDLDENITWVNEVTIHGHVPVRSTSQKTWMCGDFHANLVGGFNRDCAWK
jgi:hypothetical protein